MNILFLTGDYLTQPLGIAYLSAALGRAGHDSEVAALGDMPRQHKLLKDFKPDILCLSLVTGQHDLFFRAARQIKKEHPHIHVFAGGPHPTFYPECIHEDGVDAICRGEGDRALPAMVQALKGGGRLPGGLPNWWIKNPDGSVSTGDVDPLIDDLDSLPYPDRDIFDRALGDMKRVTSYVMTSRGCPYRCSYCFNHAYNKLYKGKGLPCRRRSVANVIKEIALLRKRYPLQIVVFQDDTFNLSTPWLEEFTEQYPREISIPFHCHLRADLLNEATAALLKRAGCLSVKLGLESAEEPVRNGILNRSMSLEQFEHACMLLHKNKIRFATENILAIPGSTLDDDLSTYEVNRRVRPQHSFATLMQVYPLTDIAAYAVKQGFVDAPPEEFPRTFYDDSSIHIGNKEERGRLRALFALGVSFGLPASIIRALLKYRLRSLYECLDRLWKGYCLRFRIYPYRQSPADFIRETLQYLGNKYY